MTNNNETNTLYLQWDDIILGYSIVIIEENDVVWAYLHKGQRIVSDVWLYNTKPSPQCDLWKYKGTNIPCMNSVEYLWEEQLVPNNANIQLTVISTKDTNGIYQVEICIDIGKDTLDLILLAVLREGEHPGWCRNAYKDNRCAKNLTDAIKGGIYLSEGWKINN
jgi:hypothetical protein